MAISFYVTKNLELTLRKVKKFMQLEGLQKIIKDKSITLKPSEIRNKKKAERLKRINKYRMKKSVAYQY